MTIASNGAVRCRMDKSHCCLWVLALMLALTAGGATAQGTAPGADTSSEKISIDSLKGIWVRPDGGYAIVIKGVASNGQLDAMYYNPTSVCKSAGIAGKRDVPCVVRNTRGWLQRLDL